MAVAQTLVSEVGSANKGLRDIPIISVWSDELVSGILGLKFFDPSSLVTDLDSLMAPRRVNNHKRTCL